MLFPDQTVSNAKRNEKDKAWYKSHFEYADQLLNSTSSRTNRIDTLFQNFHGKYSKKKWAEWIEKYKQGNENISKTKFIDYKLSTGKIERIKGEFTNRPLKPSVVTINKDAVSKKLKTTARHFGLMAAQPEVDQLRANGLDIYGGMPVLSLKDPNFKDKVNPKTQSEKYMTLVLDEQIRRLRLKEFGQATLQDLGICAECHAHVYITPNKKVKVDRIHPRNAIYEEIEGDEYLEKSGVMGFRIESNIQEALQNDGHKFSKEQKKALRALGNESGEWSRNGVSYVERREGRIIVWKTVLYWFSTKEVYQKYTKGDKNQFIDYYEKIITTEDYDKNREKYQRDVAAGKYEIRKSYQVTVCQAFRYGRNIHFDMKEQNYIVRRSDQDTEVFYNMTGLLWNSVDGVRLSLQEKMQDLNDMYNVVMWQIRRETGKFKGSVITFDEAFLTDGKTLNDIYYGISEEGILTYNSNAEENQGAQRMDKAGVNTVQIGDVQNLPMLLNLKIDIQNSLDRITGINEYAEGNAPASSTATQNIQGVQATRTITSPIFSSHSGFLTNVFMRVIELTKYTIGYLGDESFESIIGADGMIVMQKTRDVHQDDYGVIIADPNREAAIREKLTMYGQVALNAGEIRISDVLESELTTTMPDAVAVFKEGLRKMDEIKAKEQENMLKSQSDNVEKQINFQKEDREDVQAAKLDEIRLKGEMDLKVKSLDGKQKHLLQDDKPE